MRRESQKWREDLEDSDDGLIDSLKQYFYTV